MKFRLVLVLYSLLLIGTVRAQERAGQSGGQQFLVNPFARSSGFGGLNTSSGQGIEAIFTNPAGLALTRKTEVVLAHTQYLVGTGVSINDLGISQALGAEGGVLGLNLMAFNFGEIPITTIDNPDGGLGTFSPSFFNISASYARAMIPDRIFVGFAIKLMNESIPNASASAVGIDAGVQYRDRKDRIKIGVALRNIGPEVQYSGDGLQLRTALGGNNSLFTSAVSTNTSKDQLPAQLLIGFSYDFKFGSVYTAKESRKEQQAKTKKDSTAKANDEQPADSVAAKKQDVPTRLITYEHRVSPTFSFISNSFTNDNIGLGVEYSYRNALSARLAYVYETNILSEDNTKTIFNGLAAGVSLEVPFGKINEGTRRRMSSFGVDYAFRSTYIFGGVHTVGIRFTL
jgi:hypothetical protein